MTVLKQVLQTFENADRPLSLTQMARELKVEPALLDEMIAYWVRKGKLREVAESGCAACALHDHCSPIIKLPRRYELATGRSADQPRCACCG